MAELHISQKIRRRYQLDEALFQTDGHVVIANFKASRELAQKINTVHDPDFPPSGVRSGELHAVGLIDEIFHYVISLYQKQKNPLFYSSLIRLLDQSFSQDDVDDLLVAFIQEFPPNPVYHRQVSAQAYLLASENGTPNRDKVLEELLLIWMANQNRAYQPLNALFNDQVLHDHPQYHEMIQFIEQYSKGQPGFGPRELDLVQLLRSPAQAVPDSIPGQLDYIRTEWGYLLGDYLLRILSSLDVLKEESKLGFLGPGPVEIPLYDYAQAGLGEEERYSRDSDWMPNLVLIAKNSYVWLHQLSVQYHRPIRTLSDIPDEELQQLARRGINGLWLIGLWERSRASARIKQLCGNPEAISSAYALRDYQIAGDLGGEAAYQNLDSRARRYGIRLASDMVPNHMAIDSTWVYEHPDWFISLPYSPFPAYQFNGPDLSDHPDVGVMIDDHYYTRTDAAVVFKRFDKRTGSEMYIYHGNDGTSLPWNDTAQLNYLKPEVREAIIQTIIQVAKRFPIIRFDAAMTLTRKHFHRLWFPQPGSGGDIPSRAEYVLTDEEFDKAMPAEFWREVVDRMAVEAPDTLLLAEAFWLMESYFVRTLGMHRVYNSAFMHLLRDEDNAKYRALIKNTLEFDPEIMKRFVNFLNNPDERTAIDQFGNGDKYFGVCTLMVTLPGLPMFGHGQIEGYTEKYGMEYRRAYRDETPDGHLVWRHEQQIFPLCKKRYLFANSEHFLLYDFFTPQGQVDENVYAYSNRAGQETALVIYNNRYESTSGWIRKSAAFMEKTSDARNLIQRSLHEGLNLQTQNDTFTICTDQVTGLEYLYRNTDLILNGLYFELNGYQSHVFINFRQVLDTDGTWQRLHEYLGGRGTPGMDDAFFDMRLRPVLDPLRQIFNRGYFDALLAAGQSGEGFDQYPDLLPDTREMLRNLISGLTGWLGRDDSSVDLIEQKIDELSGAILLLNLSQQLPSRTTRTIHQAVTVVEKLFHNGNTINRILLFSSILLKDLGCLDNREMPGEVLDAWFSELRISRLFGNFLKEMGIPAGEPIDEGVAWLRWLVTQGGLPEQALTGCAADWLRVVFAQPLTARLLKVNCFENVEYFSKEKFEDYCGWLEALNVLENLSNPGQAMTESLEKILTVVTCLERLTATAKRSGYQTEKFFNLLTRS